MEAMTLAEEAADRARFLGMCPVQSHRVPRLVFSLLSLY